MMKIYRGVCRGGPFDGKQLEWEAGEYRVPIRPPIEVSLTSEPPPDIVELQWGTYRHMVAGALPVWVWRDDD